MASRFVANREGMKKLDEAVMRDRVEYVADMRSVYEDLAPKGVTGDLAASAEQFDTKDESVLGIMQSYAPYIEWGTEPGHRLPLIPVKLGPRIVTQIRKRSRGKLPAKSKDRGIYLVPIIWDWVRKVLAVKGQADAYMTCWAIYRKIYRKGITAQYPLSRTIEIMKQKEHLYTLTKSTNGKIDKGRGV